jgi:hypothetical protein
MTAIELVHVLLALIPSDTVIESNGPMASFNKPFVLRE